MAFRVAPEASQGFTETKLPTSARRPSLPPIKQKVPPASRLDLEPGDLGPGAFGTPFRTALPDNSLPNISTPRLQQQGEPGEDGDSLGLCQKAWGTPSPPPQVPLGKRRSARRQPFRRHLQLSGIQANEQEARSAYNSVDPGVQEHLNERVEHFIDRFEHVNVDKGTGIYVLIERCHSCEVHHGLTTRHDELQYATLSQKLLEAICVAAKDCVIGAEEMLCQLEGRPRSLGCSYAAGQDVWHHASRVGAFEVYLLTPPPSPDLMSGKICFPAGAQGGPLRSSRLSSSGHGKGDTWGAQTILHCGYTATLLHSKLSSKGWPNEKQVLKRLFASIPKGCVTVSVYSANGQMLPRFDVVVRETKAAPSRRDTQELARLEGEGLRGMCQIEEIPLQTELELQVFHATMRPQTVTVSVQCVSANVTLGTDIVFRLWALEVPGGLGIYASTDDAHPSRIPEKANPLEGYIEMSTGEQQFVQGRLELPWCTFDPADIQPAKAFTMLRRLSVYGYHPGELAQDVSACTMHQVCQQECLEIAMLSSPEVLVQVVMPGSLRPIPGVHVTVEAELQQGVTDNCGSCLMILRPGEHTVKLLHCRLAPRCVCQEITVMSMTPRLLVPLPLHLRLWSVPLTIRGKVCTHDIWLTAAGDDRHAGWFPFEGSLQTDDGGRLVTDTDGFISLGTHPCVPLDEASLPSNVVADPLIGLSLIPPFTQRFVEGEDPGDCWDADMELAMHIGPRLLGTRSLHALRESPAASTGASSPPTLTVRSMTCCCGHGVPGVKVSIDRGPNCDLRSSITGIDGLCTFAGLSTGDHAVTVEHAALPTGRTAYTARGIGFGGVTSELPLCFSAEICFYILDEASGQHRVYAAGGGTEVPSGAQPFTGVILDNTGRQRELPRLGENDEILPIALTVDGLAPGSPCPFSVLRVIPEIHGLQWFPIEPSPLSQGGCALQRLLGEGPLIMGALKPCATVTHIDGRSFSLPLEEFPTVGHAVEHLATVLEVRPEVSLTLVSSSRVLRREEPLPASQPLEVLVPLRFRVTFGTSDIGVPGVSVEILHGARLRGQESDVQARTASDGCCVLFARAGDHAVVATHPLIDGGSSHLSLDVRELRTEFTLEASASLHIFSLLPGEDTPSVPTSVWLCAHPGHVPVGARPVRGTLRVRSQGSGESSLTPREIVFDGASVGPATLQNGDRRDGRAAVPLMPAGGIAFDCAADDCIWCPEATWLLEEQDAWRELLKGPLRVGLLRLPVTVRCHGLEEPLTLRLPADAHCCAFDISLAVAHQVGLPADTLAVFANDRLLQGNDSTRPRALLDVWPMATVSLQLVTGCCGEPFPGIGITLDSVSIGASDEEGMRTLTMSVGVHSLGLEHQAFGLVGHVSHEITVRRGQANNFVFPVDVRLFFYATDPEQEEHDDDAVSEGYGPIHDPSCVWVAADAVHIPDDAVAPQGCVSCQGAVQARLSQERIAACSLGFQHADGLVRESRCQLSGLSLECSRGGFLWAEKEMSPLLERVEELGGCEFLRLLECPIVLGFLKPTVRVQCADGTRLDLPLQDYGNIDALRVRVAEELGVHGDEGVANLVLETEDGSPLPTTFLVSQVPHILCARPGEELAWARETIQRSLST